MHPTPRQPATAEPTRPLARLARLALVVTLLPFAVACSGDGQSDDGGLDPLPGIDSTIPGVSPGTDTGDGPTTSGTPPSTDEPSSPPPQTASGGAVNGPLTGRLITTGDTPHRNAILSLDLQSGVYSYRAGADSPVNIASVNYESTERLFAADHSSPGRFVETVYRCNGRTNFKCVILWENGAITGEGFFYDNGEADLPGESLAKRSRDGRLIAFTDERKQTLEIRTLDGTIVSEGSYNVLGTNSPYDWLSDDSLLLEYDKNGNGFGDTINFVRTEPGTVRRASTIDMPARYSGSVRNLVVDPSGTRVAMTVRRSPDDGNDRRPVVLDVNTLEIFEPVAPDAATGTLDANFLHWSPDGQWLIFQNPRYRPLVTTIPISTRPGVGLPRSVTYAVRADGGSYVLPTTVEESNENARIIVARPKDMTDGPLDPGNAEPGYVWVD